MLETQRSPRGTVYTLESLAQIPEENVPEKMWDRVLRDGSYQASAPGQVPNILSEALFKSMSVEVEVPSGPVTNDNALNINGTIAINSPYAAKLEFGSVEDNLEPRPFIVPAFEEARRPVKNYMSVPAHIQEAGQDAFLSKFFSGKIK